MASRTYGDAVNFVAVVLDEEADGSAEILDGFGLSAIPNVIDEDRGIWNEFEITSHPSIVLLHPDGTFERTTGQLGPWKLQDNIDAMLASAGAVRS